MSDRATMLEALGGEEGCQRLSAAFYARVAKDPVLRRLFPGKTLRCATEEFAAFLVQFLGGDEEQTQKRWWLSLSESHARLRIDAGERQAWLTNMRAALEAAPLDGEMRAALGQFFVQSSAYIVGKDAAEPEHEELASRWHAQRILDRAIGAIAAGEEEEALAIAPRFASRPSVFVGLLARMMQSGRPRLIRFVLESVENEPSLLGRRFATRTLLHFASAAGCVEVVALLLRLGADPEAQDGGSHTPLYSVANECACSTGPEVVRILAGAGANVNACDGVTRATPLHMAARRGHLEIARTLLACGASIHARDRKGDTPLRRARNCRKNEVAELLLRSGATG
jgi:hemoglobin